MISDKQACLNSRSLDPVCNKLCTILSQEAEPSKYDCVETQISSWVSDSLEAYTDVSRQPYPLSEEHLTVSKKHLQYRASITCHDKDSSNTLVNLVDGVKLKAEQIDLYADMCLESLSLAKTIYHPIEDRTLTQEVLMHQEESNATLETMDTFIVVSEDEPPSSEPHHSDGRDSPVPATSLGGSRNNWVSACCSPSIVREILDLGVSEGKSSSKEQPLAYYESPVHHVYVTITDFFLNAMVEPCFGSLALYNIKTHKKVTETYSFSVAKNMHYPISHKLLVIRPHYTTNTFIFDYKACDADALYLVIRIEKLLERRPAKKVAENYSKMLDQKALENRKAEACKIIENMASYRMPLAFNYVPLVELLKYSSDQQVSFLETISPSFLVSYSPTMHKTNLSPNSKVNRDRSMEDSFSESKSNYSITSFYATDFTMTDEFILRHIKEATDPTLPPTPRKSLMINAVLSFSISYIQPEVISQIPKEVVISGGNVRVLKTISTTLRYPLNTFVNEIYIYPKSLNISKTGFNSKNLQLMFFFLESEIKDIISFRNQVLTSHTDKNCTCVQFHQREPRFYEEMKIELPPYITSDSHLLIIVKNVSISSNLMINNEIVGFTWIPLLYKESVCTGRFELPVAYDNLPHGYSHVSARDCTFPVKWYDSKKPILSLRIKLNSSIYTKSQRLRNSFPFHPKNIFHSEDTCRKFNKLFSVILCAPIKCIIKHFSTLLNFCLCLINESTNMEIMKNGSCQDLGRSMSTFKNVVDLFCYFFESTPYMRNSNNRNVWLSDYITDYALNGYVGAKMFQVGPSVSLEAGFTYRFKEFSHKLIYLILAYTSVTSSATKIARMISFFFDLIIKDLTVTYCYDAGGCEYSKRPMVDPSLINLLKSLLKLLCKSVVEYNQVKLSSDSRILNKTISQFLHRLFYVLHRGIAINLLELYLDSLIEDDDTEYNYFCLAVTLGEFMMDINVFLVELPSFYLKRQVGSGFDLESYVSCYKSYKKSYSLDHYITPLWIKYLVHHFSSGKNVEIGKYLISSMAYIINMVEANDKLERSVAIPKDYFLSNAVATLIFPICEVVFAVSKKFIPSLATQTVSHQRPNKKSIFTGGLYYRASKVNLKLLQDVSIDKNPLERVSPFNTNTIQGLFLLYIWVLRFIKLEFFYQLWDKASVEFQQSFLNVLITILTVFSGAELSKAESKQQTLAVLKKLVLSSTARINRSLAVRDDSQTRLFASSSKSITNPILETSLESCYKTSTICNAVGETIIYMTSNLLEHVALGPDSNHVANEFLKLFVHCISLRQPVRFHQTIIDIIHYHIKKFKHVLFNRSNISNLKFINALVVMAKSPINDLRDKVCQILFLLIKLNYKEKKNLTYIRVLLSTAVSSVITGETMHILTSNLLASLKTLLGLTSGTLSLSDSSTQSMLQNIVFMIEDYLMATQHEKTFHDKIDIMRGIAGKLNTVIVVRIQWLIKIRDVLQEHLYLLQAGFASLHAAMMVMQYLVVHRNPKILQLPYGPEIFRRITSNFDLEDFTYEMMDFGIEEWESLSFKGFIDFLEYAYEYFIKCKAIHFCLHLGDILQRCYNINEDFALSIKLNETYANNLRSLEKLNKIPELASYFRVYIFKDADTPPQEYIYIEQAHTKLPDFIVDIEKAYQSAMPNTEIEIIRDSAPVDTSTFRANTFYIQVTSVTPYEHEFTKSDKAAYDRASDHRLFCYVTPFTLSGKARGDLLEQYQRLTILETKSFLPNYSKREKVISRSEVIQEPIEVIHNDILKRTSDLDDVLRTHPIDYKMLQLNLQGCVGTTVNQGPMEAVRTFLEPFINADVSSIDSPYRQTKFLRGINKLCLTCHHLLKLCQTALSALEEKEVKETTYTEVMKNLFAEFSIKLNPLLDNASKKLQNILSLT